MKRKNVLRSASRKLLRTFFCLNRLTCFLFLLVVLISIKIIRVYQSTRCCWYSSDIIVSLTSTPQRFHHELPLTIHSLLSQTQLPQEIRLRLSPISNLTEFQLKKSLEKIDSSVDLHQRFDRLVKIYYENEDYGPGTKFIPIIREFHRTNDSKLQNQRLIICDDDQYYHHETISTLNFYSEKYPNSIVGLRGWRSKTFRFDVKIEFVLRYFPLQ